MIDESTHDQAIDFVLGCLPDDQLAEFDSKLTADAELRALVEELRNSTALLAYSAPAFDLPPTLRQNVLNAVHAEKLAVNEATSQPATGATSPSAQRSTWLPWAVAAAIAIFAGILWTNNQSLMQQSRELATQTAITEDLFQQVAELKKINQTAAEEIHASEKQLAAASEESRTLQSEISALRERSAIAEMKVATLTSQIDTSYLASIAWSQDDQTGILHVRRLPEAERGKDYQLWVLDKNRTAPISAGTFRVAADGSATIEFAPTQSVSADSSFAVSLEKSGGSVSPEGPIVLAN